MPRVPIAGRVDPETANRIEVLAALPYTQFETESEVVQTILTAEVGA